VRESFASYTNSETIQHVHIVLGDDVFDNGAHNDDADWATSP
jgi:hypothetical protein